MNNEQKPFQLLNAESGHFEGFTIEELFEMLNRDRSEDWSAYDENSTLIEIVEGINEFTEYEI